MVPGERYRYENDILSSFLTFLIILLLVTSVNGSEDWVKYGSVAAGRSSGNRPSSGCRSRVAIGRGAHRWAGCGARADAGSSSRSRTFYGKIP